MAHENRWFTWVYLLKMVDLSMAMLNNQRYIKHDKTIQEVWMENLVLHVICSNSNVEEPGARSGWCFGA